jgi:hypothetical protein
MKCAAGRLAGERDPVLDDEEQLLRLPVRDPPGELRRVRRELLRGHRLAGARRGLAGLAARLEVAGAAHHQDRIVERRRLGRAERLGRHRPLHREVQEPAGGGPVLGARLDRDQAGSAAAAPRAPAPRRRRGRSRPFAGAPVRSTFRYTCTMERPRCSNPRAARAVRPRRRRRDSPPERSCTDGQEHGQQLQRPLPISRRLRPAAGAGIRPRRLSGPPPRRCWTPRPPGRWTPPPLVGAAPPARPSGTLLA